MRNCYQNLFLLSCSLFVLILNQNIISKPDNKDIHFGGYLKSSLLGTLAVIPPVILLGRTYFSETACRERGDECDPYETGPRLISIAFTIGSSAGMALHAQNKWKAFSLSIIMNSIPIALMYKNFSFYLIFYFPLIPFIAAYIGYETDLVFHKKRSDEQKMVFVPQLFVSKSKIATGVSICF